MVWLKECEGDTLVAKRLAVVDTILITKLLQRKKEQKDFGIAYSWTG